MKDLFVNTQLPVVTSDRILYTPSNFARTSLLYLQEIGSLQVHKPHSTGRSNLSSYLFFTVTDGEYSCAVTPQVRQTGNRLSGLAGTAYASLLT